MTEEENSQQEDTIPFYPDHARTEARVVLGILVLAGIIGVLGLWMKIGLGPPADPMNTPAHVKPEWYFLFLYQLLKYLPKTIGVLLPIFLVVVLLLWPFLDRRKDSLRARRFRIILASMFLLAAVVLTLLAALS